MVPKAAITLLHPPENKPGYARSVSFMNGLNQVADIFNKRFRVTTPGMRQPHWAENENQLKQKMVKTSVKYLQFLNQVSDDSIGIDN